MKDFVKVFLLILGCIVLFLGLSLLTFISPFILSIIGIIMAVLIISTGIYLSRKRSHNLPKDKQEKHLKDYKNHRKNL